MRVLVAYATGTGSTTGVAEEIGRTLAARGYAVDVMQMSERPAVAEYDAVVLGSAVNGGKWLPQAVSFVQDNAECLGRAPVAAFCVHSMNGGSDAKQTRKRLAYLDSVRAAVNLVDEGYFLGVGPTKDDTGAFARWAFKTFGGTAEGDSRDWDAIREWAEGLAV